MNVKSLVEKWTTQAGYPVLMVQMGTGNFAQLQQKRFYLKENEASKEILLWSIPLTWASKSNPNFLDTTPKYWMSKSVDTVDLEIAKDEWIIFNVQESGTKVFFVTKKTLSTNFNYIIKLNYISLHFSFKFK